MRERCMRNSSWQEGWTSWDSAGGNLNIRRHVWETDMTDEDDERHISSSREVRHWSNGEDDGIAGSSLDSVPSLEAGKKFDLILASDVTYFRSVAVAKYY